jgi:dimethylhistidine N-methyltransferase
MEVIVRSALGIDRDEHETFLADVIAGLTDDPKRLGAKYFYDAAGSQLFEEITRLPEYYPTRTEMGILRRDGARIMGKLAPGTALVEFGSGSTAKVRVLLDAAPKLAAYVPVDISAEFLGAEATRLQDDYPHLKVLPVAADFTGLFELPPQVRGRPLVGFFPGSTIGNFEPHEADAFLRRAARILGPSSRLIVGVDLVKNESVLNAAYNDAAGVTARFNLTVLNRINRELGADFDLAQFEHRAFFNAAQSRIEIYLISRVRQAVHEAGVCIRFAKGESIRTEYSYKYRPEAFRHLADDAGLQVQQVWTDSNDLFSVQYLVVKS